MEANKSPLSPQVQPHVQIAAQPGSFSNVGASSDASSQLALLDEKMWAVGNIDTSVSKDPAGTISTPAV
jgi:hypothetical protein